VTGMISLDALKDRNAALLCSGQMVSQVCDKMMLVGLVWVLLERASPSAVAWFLAVSALPHLLLALHAGRWTAAFGPLKTVIASDAARAVVFVLLAALWPRVGAQSQVPALFAASFAAAYPDRATGLMLLSPAVGYSVLPGQPLPESVQARIDDLVALGPVEFAAKRAARLVYRPESKPAVLEGVRRAMAAIDPDGYAQAVRALGAGLLRADAARVTAPSLVAVGARDVVTPPVNAEAVKHALQHCGPMVVVPDAGHALPQEAPAIVARLLETLIQDVSHG